MESVYSPELFKSTERLNFKQYFAEFSERLYPFQRQVAANDDEKEDIIFKMMNLGVADRATIQQACNPSHLTVPGEAEPVDKKMAKFDMAINVKHMDISTVKDRLQTVKKTLQRKANSNADRIHLSHLNTAQNYSVERQMPTTDLDLTPGKDILIFVRLYEPNKYEYFKRSKRLKFVHDVVLLGSNTLADLRDEITCSSDQCVSVDMSENPKDASTPVAKEVYPSGTLFIDNVFYNDFRNEKSIDYSAPIIKWAKEKNIGEFTTAPIETKLEDLRPRIGYPYVFQHQGHCEHIFVFADMRLATAADALSSKCYPHKQSIGRFRATFCYFCGISVANWAVVGGDRLPNQVCYMCEECFLSYNYVDGKKVGRFRAYKFADKTHLMAGDADAHSSKT